MLKLKVSFLLAVVASVVFSIGNTDAQTDKKQEDDAKKLKVGDKAPDFNLETFDDKKVKLSDRFGKNGHPVVLLFSRANW